MRERPWARLIMGREVPSAQSQLHGKIKQIFSGAMRDSADAKSSETCNRCQAQENMQPVQTAGKRA